MSVAAAIIERLETLPEPAQGQVLDFAEYLAWRAGRAGEDREWQDFSLASAMRGMEDEESPYSVDDLKESFR